MIDLLKQKLAEANVKIIREDKLEFITELTVDIIPGIMLKPTGAMRKELYNFFPFFIKSPDSGKFRRYRNNLEELKLEVAAWKIYRDQIPIVEKVAILHLDSKENKKYIVEIMIEPFTNEEDCKKKGHYEEAKIILEEAVSRFPNVGDFQYHNMGYDPSDGKIKFFDVFPQEELMSDESLRCFVEDLKERFSKVYLQKDYPLFKKNADRFLDFFRALQSKDVIDLDKNFDGYINDGLKSRVFLGIAVELILKAAYLKNGYLINSVKDKKEDNFPKGISKPYKINEVPDKNIKLKNTVSLSYLLDNLHLFFKEIDYKEYITYVKKGIEIAKIWRDKEMHVGGGYHLENGNDIIDVGRSLFNIYKIIFNEDLKPLLPSGRKNFLDYIKRN
ncbi:MAG: hypothetical protein Q7S55_04620 [Nanoarchaeota archaeon]|nr:hypothetical protein [Nanoarchaeota archaeon]